MFGGREAAELLQSAGKVMAIEEFFEMAAQQRVAVVAIALHRGLLDGAVHALCLTN